MKNETTTKNEKLPFPSTVKSACPNTDVQAVAREIVDTSRDVNNLFASAGNVHNFVRAHYVDTSTGTYGIESLIASILAANNSVFPAGIETTEFRNVAISASMFASEIIAAVRVTFGKERYPDATIYSYLAHFMLKSGRVGKIKLKNSEDSMRNCCKPRTKYYLVEKA